MEHGNGISLKHITDGNIPERVSYNEVLSEDLSVVTEPEYHFEVTFDNLPDPIEMTINFFETSQPKFKFHSYARERIDKSMDVTGLISDLMDVLDHQSVYLSVDGESVMLLAKVENRFIGWSPSTGSKKISPSEHQLNDLCTDPLESLGNQLPFTDVNVEPEQYLGCIRYRSSIMTTYKYLYLYENCILLVHSSRNTVRVLPSPHIDYIISTVNGLIDESGEVVDSTSWLNNHIISHKI